MVLNITVKANIRFKIDNGDPDNVWHEAFAFFEPFVKKKGGA